MGKGMPMREEPCAVCSCLMRVQYEDIDAKITLCWACKPEYQEPVDIYEKSEGYADLSLKEYLARLGYEDK